MGNNNSVEDGNKGNNEGQAQNEENNQQQEQQNDNDNKEPEKKPKLNELLGDPNSTAAVAQKRDAKFFGKEDKKKDKKQGGLNQVQELSLPQDNVDENEESETCGICGEIFFKEDYYKLEICGHPFCVSCLYEYSKDLLEESLDRDDKKLKCPLPNCNCDISVKDLQIGLEVFGGKSKNNNNDEEIDDDIEPVVLNPVVDRALRKSGYSPNERLPISLTASLEIMITQSENYVQCPNKLCQFVIERIPLSKNDPRRSQKVLDDKGKPLSPDALDHYLNHRFRCRHCDTIFCAQCKATPYHLGKTCRQYMQSFYSKKCRFCKEDVPDITQPYQPEGFKQSWLDKWRHKRAEAKRKKQERDLTQSKMIKLVAEREAQMEAAGEFYLCKDEECHEKVKSACMHVLPCNHLCPGVKDEPYHCQCLRDECNEDGDICGDDFCNICWIEPLNAAPVVDLPCGHMFHYQCLVDKLKEGPTTDFLSYKFADCPLCKKEIDHPTLDFLLSPIRQQQQQVIKLARRRLQIEGMEDDEDLQEGHYYHNDPDGYALHVFAFYECFQCKKPYFGGKRECDPGNPDDDGSDENKQKKKELQRCAACSGLNATCNIHGTDFIEFKCRFCCSLATFFCGGKCHYCTPCHDIAGTLTNFSDWSTKWDCGKINDCEGWEKCPLHVEHPKNGEEFALGCAACRADHEKEIEERKKKKKENNNNN